MNKKVYADIFFDEITISKPVPRTIKGLYNMFCDLYPNIAKDVTGWYSAGFTSDHRAIELEILNGPKIIFMIDRRPGMDWHISPYVRLRDKDSKSDVKVASNNHKCMFNSFCKMYPELVEKVTKYEGNNWAPDERSILIHTTYGNVIDFVLTNQAGKWEKTFVDYIFLGDGLVFDLCGRK